MMQIWQFAVIVVLLLWIIWKLPTPSRVDATVNQVMARLNGIAAVLNVDEIERARVRAKFNLSPPEY
jgi:hypothetical protein